MSRFSKILCLLLVVSLGLSAKSLNNIQHPDGTPILIPQPQKIAYDGPVGKKVFALGNQLEIDAPASCKLEISLIDRALKERFPGKTAVAARNGKCKLTLTTQGVPKNPEGYTLKITPAGIQLCAKELRGLYYGVQTLCDLIRKSTKPALPALAIEDWPDLKVRGIYPIWLANYTSDKIPHLLHNIEQLGALKYNTFYLELNNNFPYKKNPFTKRPHFLTLEDVTKIRDTAAAHHVEIVPGVQVISHDAWLKFHPKYETDIAEGKPSNPWSCSSCPTRPLPRELNLMAIREQIAFFKPRYFVLFLDEISQCPWNACPACKATGKTGAQLWEEVTLFYTNEVLKLGVIPLIAHDSYYPGNAVQGEKVLAKLDPRVAIINWDYGYSIKSEIFDFFKPYNLKIHGMSYCVTLENTASLPRAIKQRGMEGVVLSLWHYLPAFYKYKYNDGITPEALAGIVTAADYQWHVRENAVSTLDYDAAYEGVKHFVPPLVWKGRAEQKMTPLPMGSAFNAVLGKDESFPMLQNKEILALQKQLKQGVDSFDLVLQNGGYCAAVVGNAMNPGFPAKEVVIPVGTKADQLNLLITASRPQNVKGEICYYKPKLGRLQFVYEDGKMETIFLKHRQNTTTWNATASGLYLRGVARFTDQRDAIVTLSSFDWNNPRKNVAIKEIRLQADPASPMATAIYAVSGCGAAFKPKANAPKTLKSASAKADGAKYDFYSVLDFENGLKNSIGNSLFGTQGKFITRPTWTIVSSDKCPTPGKVLRVTVPPAEDKFFRMNRIMLDIPVDFSKIPFDAKTIELDCQIDIPTDVYLPSLYLLNQTRAGGYLIGLGFLRKGRRTLDNQWNHYSMPIEAMKKEGKGIEKKDVRYLRISFFLKSNTRSSFLQLARIGFSDNDRSLPLPFSLEKNQPVLKLK